MSTKKILIVSSVFVPEPVVSARMSSDIAEELIRRDEKVMVFAPYPSRPAGSDYSNFVIEDKGYERIIPNTYMCPKSSLSGRMHESFSFGRASYKFIKTHKDSISVIYANTIPLLGVYYVLRASHKFNIPVILHIQDLYPESLLTKLSYFKTLIEKLFLSIDRKLYRYAKSIIAISDGMKKTIVEKRKLPVSQVVVIRNWQDDRIFVERQGSTNANNKFTYMYVGSINLSAKVDYIIKSFIKADIPNSQLIIAGDGSERSYCENLVKTQGVNNILFQSVKPAEVPEVQSQADVLLLALQKGVGMTASPSKLIAYMLSGKPIITAVDSGSDTEHIIKTANCGIVVESEDEHALGKAMLLLHGKDKESLNELGKNARSYALHNMTKSVNLNALVNIILQNKS